MRPFSVIAAVAGLLATLFVTTVAFAFTETEEKAIIEAAAIGDWREMMDESGLTMAVKVEPMRLREGIEDATVTLTSEQGGTGVFGMEGQELIVMLRGRDGRWIKAMSAAGLRVRPVRVTKAMPEIELIGGWPLRNPPAMRECNPVWAWRGEAYEFARWLCPGTRAVAELAQTSKPRTIVGLWRLAGHQCTPFDGAIQIRPLAIHAEDGYCEFKSVSRVGEVVRWVGACGSGDEAMEPTVVIARAYGDRLTLQYGHRPEGPPYMRCNRSRFDE